MGTWLEQLRPGLTSLDLARDTLPINGYRPAPKPSKAAGKQDVLRQSEFWSPRPAAVLIPIIDLPEPTVLFTARSRSLSNHSGQVSFPGGAVERGDRDEIAAAVRETFEETGIEPDSIQPLGVLDFYDTISGFRVLPVVARVQPGFTLKLQAAEVEAAFEVPLSLCLDRGAYQPHFVNHDGRDYELHRLRHQGWTIWGATAGMLVNLQDRIERAALQNN